MMNQKINPPLPRAARRKLPLSLVWVLSTLLLGAVFVIAQAPRAAAQDRDTQGGQYTSIFRNVFEFIQRHYVDEVDPALLYEGAMTGMFNALGDPHSAYLPEQEMTDLNDTTQGNFGGVGLYISKPFAPAADGKPQYLEVASPIEDTPGFRAGINPGDLIIEINGESTDTITTDEAVALLRGVPGSTVDIIIRRGEKVEFPVTLTREVIEVPTVKHAMIGDIGYLKLLPPFTPMTVDRSREAIADFQEQGYRSLILDLRNNGGGLLNAAVGICNLFVEGGVVVSTRSRINAENQVFYARGRALVPQNIPVIVLINRGAASASEIVAGALKDRGRAYLVGEKTYGKGSVQQPYTLEKGGFKITTARYYTPSDVNIDKIGIPPDREILFPDFTEDDAEKFNELMNGGRIASFGRENQGAGPEKVTAFAAELASEYGLDITLLARLIRNELNRTTIAPAYDLEYDVQLIEAVKIIREEDFLKLMKTTKTLKTLQEEAIGEEEVPAAS